MNAKEFDKEMKKHGDNKSSLARMMGYARITLSRKINEWHGASFTAMDLEFFRKRWKLSDERFVEIFFGTNVS